MKPRTAGDPNVEDDRDRAIEVLEHAQRNPVLSGDQSCAVAQVHALLAIEERLAQLCSSLEAMLVALVNPSRSDERNLAAVAPSLLS